MKKLMKVSLVAMLVAAPFAANATSALPVAYSDGSTTTKPSVTAVADVASTSYVKGAYDTLAEAINEVNSNALTVSTAETGTFSADAANAQSGDVLAGLDGTPTISEAVNLIAGQVDANTADIATKADANDVYTKTEVDTKISGLDGTTANTSLSESNGVLTVEVDGTHVTRDSTTGALTLSSADATAIADVANKANSSFVGTLPQNAQATTVVGYIDEAVAAAGGQTAQEVQDAIDAAAGAGIATDGSGTLSVDLTSNGGLEFSGNGDAQTVGVKVDGTHIIKDSTTGAVTLSSADATAIADVANKADAADLGDKTNLSNDFTAAQKTDVVTAVNAAMAEAKTSKYVTVHTTWGNDATTASANVLTTTAPASGS